MIVLSIVLLFETCDHILCLSMWILAYLVYVIGACWKAAIGALAGLHIRFTCVRQSILEDA